MRNPKRIDNTLKQLALLWKKHPDLRLGQLIANLVDPRLMLYMEDDELLKKTKEALELW